MLQRAPPAQACCSVIWLRVNVPVLHHDRQALGHGRHGDGDCRQKHLGEALPACHPEHQGQQREAHDGDTDPASEIPKTLLERREGAVDRTDLACNRAQLGMRPGRDHDPAAAAGGDGGTGERNVAALRERDQAVVWQRLDLLGHRKRLAREQCLVDLQRGPLDQTQIRGDEISTGETDDVAGNQRLTRHLRALPGAFDRGPWGQQLHQRGDGVLGAILLQEADPGVEHQHDPDHDRVLPVPDRE
jgi:hypothetical protein